MKRFTLIFALPLLFSYLAGNTTARAQVVVTPHEMESVFGVADRIPSLLVAAGAELNTPEQVKAFRELASILRGYVEAAGLFRQPGSAAPTEFGKLLAAHSHWLARSVSAQKPAPRTSLLPLDLIFDTLEAFSDERIATDRIFASWLTVGADGVKRKFDQLEATRNSSRLIRSVPLASTDFKILTGLMALGVVSFAENVATNWQRDPSRYLPQVEAARIFVNKLQSADFSESLEELSQQISIVKTAQAAIADTTFLRDLHIALENIEHDTHTGEHRWASRNVRILQKGLEKLHKRTGALSLTVIDMPAACPASFVSP